MVRPGLRSCYAINEARRGRKRAPLSGEDLISKNSEYIRFMQKISKENVDEDYFNLLKSVYFYDKNSLSYTNECQNDGCTDEVEDEDEADTQHTMFDCSNEGFEIDYKDEADPQHMMFDGGFEIDDEDEADPLYKMFLTNAKPDGRSYVVKVDTKDGSPVLIKYEKECGCNYLCERSSCKKMKNLKMQKNAVKEKTLVNTSRKDEAKRQSVSRAVPGFDKSKSTVECGASKRQGKCGTKIKSGNEPGIEKGKPVNFVGKENAADVDYSLYLKEEYQFENWGMKALSRNGNSFEYEAAEDEIEILDNNSGMLKNVGICTSFEYEAAEDEIEILDNNSGMLKNVGICNAEDRCPQMIVQSKFREKVMDLLKKPYNSNEYKELWTEVNNRKLMERNMELRNGEVKNYKTQQLGKSYLDHYEDLKEKLTKVDDSKRKKLKILRGFFFWLQNLGYADAFTPWKDAEFLALVDESS